MKKIFVFLALLLAMSFVLAIDGNDDVNSIDDTNNNIACTIEGQSMPVYPGYECCSGLVAINPQTTAEPLLGASICSNCGNGKCEQWENEYNCTEDCKTSCAQTGEEVWVSESFGPTHCCSKNDGIKPVESLGGGTCIAPNNGQTGTCVNNWWRTCGDGKCDSSNEDICNCPKDCKNNEETIVKEQVKCIFNNTTERQKCYSYFRDETFSCATETTNINGESTCVADIAAPKGTKLMWKSTCGGYAYTIVDGENEYAKFECKTETTPIEVCTTEYKPVCGTIEICTTTCPTKNIENNTNMSSNEIRACESTCQKEMKTFSNSCEAKKAGAITVSEGKCTQNCPVYANPNCPNGKIEVVYNERGCKKPKCIAEEAEHFSGAYWKCSNGKEFKETDTCMPGSYWKEKARKTCGQYSTNCTTASGGVSGNNTTPITSTKVTTTGNFILDTVNAVTNSVNTQIKNAQAYKTTTTDQTETNCVGGEVYVTEFETFGSCAPGNETCKYYTDNEGCKVKECTNGKTERACPTKPELITNTYRKAYWQCYSGKESYEGGESSCKPVDLWKQYAEEACANECNVTEAFVCDVDSNTCETSTVKCGVNSFQVSAPCYDGNSTICSTQDEKDVKALKEKCYANNEELNVEIDSQGCRKYVCGIESNVCRTMEDIPVEKKINCEERGGEFIAKENENGCLVYLECIGEKINDENASINKEIIIDKMKLLDLAIKIETAKIELEQTAEKIKAIGDYYAGQGKDEDANRFYKAANIIEAAAQKLEEIKMEIKNNVDNFSEEQAIAIRELIRNIKEELFKEALLEMLG